MVVSMTFVIDFDDMDHKITVTNVSEIVACRRENTRNPASLLRRLKGCQGIPGIFMALDQRKWKTGVVHEMS